MNNESNKGSYLRSLAESRYNNEEILTSVMPYLEEAAKLFNFDYEFSNDKNSNSVEYKVILNTLLNMSSSHRHVFKNYCGNQGITVIFYARSVCFAW
jgi:predicted RNA-binding protein Jag